MCVLIFFEIPIGSMYGIFTYIYHTNQPNVDEYTSPMDRMGFKPSSPMAVDDMSLVRRSWWTAAAICWDVWPPSWPRRNAQRTRTAFL